MVSLEALLESGQASNLFCIGREVNSCGTIFSSAG
jgi:hypothetical protein